MIDIIYEGVKDTYDNITPFIYRHNGGDWFYINDRYVVKYYPLFGTKLVIEDEGFDIRTTLKSKEDVIKFINTRNKVKVDGHTAHGHPIVLLGKTSDYNILSKYYDKDTSEWYDITWNRSGKVGDDENQYEYHISESIIDDKYSKLKLIRK